MIVWLLKGNMMVILMVMVSNCLSREIFYQNITLDDYKMALRFVVKKNIMPIMP